MCLCVHVCVHALSLSLSGSLPLSLSLCYLAGAAHTLLASVGDVETSRLRRIAETLAWFGV